MRLTYVPYFYLRISPYEGEEANETSVQFTDAKGRRLAGQIGDPIYDTLFLTNRGGGLKALRPPGPPGHHHHLGPPSVSEGEQAAATDTFTMLNSFWFMIASLLQQGTDILPRLVRTTYVHTRSRYEKSLISGQSRRGWWLACGGSSP